MSDPLIGAVLAELFSILDQQIRQELRLVLGVDNEIQNFQTTLESIQGLLVDAEKKQIKDESVKIWLERLKDIIYDMDDVLSEWRTAILRIQIERAENDDVPPTKKVCSFITLPCFCVRRVAFRRDIALKIMDINKKLDFIANAKERYKLNLISSSEGSPKINTTSYVDVSEVCGRDENKSTLVRELLSESSQSERTLHIIALVGMGGIGKTTLAQYAYNLTDVMDYFEKRMWVCVSDPFEEVRVAKAILEDAEDKAPNLFELETVLRRLRTSIAGKKFLIVLDDVWTEDRRKWEPLYNSLRTGAAGSKVLVTTRNENVARTMDATKLLRLGQLSNDDCWSLFHRIAFQGENRKGLKDVGRKISDKCKGVPLAAKTIASLMRFKSSEKDWQNVLDSEIWELEEAEKGLFPPLLLSYHDLPSAAKPCFSYCANFPKDFKIEAENLIKLWMAQGYLFGKGNNNKDAEEIGREYLETLVMRSFFQDLERAKDGRIIRFKMHDMIHDFAQFLTKDECYIMEVDDQLVPKMDSHCKKIRHLSLVRAENVQFPTSIGGTKKLHTLLVQSFFDCPTILDQIDKISLDLFHSLTFLKALDMSRNRVFVLPEEVGKLVNLRYLNLSHNPLQELPESVCDLYNLQTLKLVKCSHLRKLPQRIGRLVNLRHLEIDHTGSLRVLPKGIGNLHSLKTLVKFVVAGSADNGEEICKLGDLENLNYLQGSLKIEGLGYVEDVDEARKANLENKKDLLHVQMEFNALVQVGGTTEVAEALRLHPGLRYLQISSYGGTAFPNWLTQLNGLKELRLHGCQNCTQLPPLGRLPSLEILTIAKMPNLKHVGLEFLGVHSGTSFPKLKKLKIATMNSWEDWDMIISGGKNIRIMPCLHDLKLSDCNVLKTLPEPLLQLTTIRRLRIQDCPLLQQQTGEQRIKISHVRNVN